MLGNFDLQWHVLQLMTTLNRPPPKQYQHIEFSFHLQNEIYIF